MTMYPQYYDSDVFLFFGCRTPQHDATRGEFKQAMQIERSDNWYLVSFYISCFLSGGKCWFGNV